MDIRILDKSEHALASAVDGVPLPPEFVVIGAFDEGGELVGRTCLIPIPHLEGTWVREDKRGTSLAIRLVRSAEATVAVNGRTFLWAFTEEGRDDLAGYMKRLGYVRMPLTAWARDLTEEP